MNTYLHGQHPMLEADGSSRPALRLGTADILLTLALFFASYHSFRFGNINLTFSDICFLAATLIYSAQHRVTALPFGSVTALWLVSLGLMLGGLFLGSMVNGDMLRWTIVSAQYVVAFLLIPMVLLAQDQQFIRRLTATFVLGVAAMQALAVAVTLWVPKQTASAILGPEFISGSGRVVAFVGDANWNGAMIAFSLPLCIYCIKSKVLPGVVAVPVLAVLAWGLLLCASFTGFAAAGVSTAIMLLFMGWRFSAILLGLFAAASLVFLTTGAPLPDAFQKRVGTAMSTGDIASAGTYPGRIDLIEEAWDVADETMLIGLGVDQFRNKSVIGQPVHNLYLLMLTEGGLIALAGLLGMILLMLVLSITNLRFLPLESGTSLAVIIVFLIYSMASPHMFARLHVIPVMLGLGLLYGITSPARQKG